MLYKEGLLYYFLAYPIYIVGLVVIKPTYFNVLSNPKPFFPVGILVLYFKPAL
jgi:hypothetical protein